MGDLVYWIKNEIPLLLLFPYLLDQMEQVHTKSIHLCDRCVLTTFIDPKYQYGYIVLVLHIQI